MLGIKDKIEQFKQEIRESNYPKYESLNKRTNKLIGTMYIKDKMDYGFHIYYIHEPNENDPLAGKNGTVSEMYYDLRNKKYWIKRNLKDVQFSVRNVDSIFPKDYDQRNQIFNIISTKSNRGLYNAAFSYLGAMGDEKREMFGRFFHRLITEHSYFELLYKAKINVDKYTHIENPNGTTPMEILGLSKTQWKMINRYGIKINMFNNINNYKADKEMINYLTYIKSLEDEYGVEKINSFFDNEFNFVYRQRPFGSALGIAEAYNLPVKKFLRYIYFECDVSQGLNASTAISQYADYIRMTTEMGYERFERYPKYLRTFHDIASRNYKVKLSEIELQEWNIVYEQNRKYEYTNGEYKIFPPKTPEDLIREGNVLSHCVGSYVNKVKKGLSTILFLRERKDIEHPLVTIEVRDQRITQARGKMNNPPTQEQNLIIKKFAEKFKLTYYAS